MASLNLGLGESLEGESCEGVKGLFKEGEKTMKTNADSDVLDAALITDAQHVERSEIAGYGGLTTHARLLGREEDASLLKQSAVEDGTTDERLTAIAERAINLDAARA